ncbi:MAG: hypothetical protein DRN29_03695 [Thermoplasmata archaeon]|nr:MAG: hypothetical protein DRN29_03695 [Thermoplasmata archaeon]
MKKIGVGIVLILAGILIFAPLLGSADGYRIKPISSSNNFEISITRPYGHLYVFDREIFPLPPMMPFKAIIIGWVTVEVDGAGVEKVEFYVDGELKSTDYDAPYEWSWKERMVAPPIHELKVIGYAGEETASDEIMVLYVNPFPSL